MPSEFYEQDVSLQLGDKENLSKFLDDLIKQNRASLDEIELTYVFCSDEYLIDINNKFLDHDTYTDIITFDLSDHDEHLISEIYISIERVEENAKEFGVSFQQELHRVIFHGALHLCGYKDKTEEEATAMRSMEEKYIRAYFNNED